MLGLFNTINVLDCFGMFGSLGLVGGPYVVWIPLHWSLSNCCLKKVLATTHELLLMPFSRGVLIMLVAGRSHPFESAANWLNLPGDMLPSQLLSWFTNIQQASTQNCTVTHKWHGEPSKSCLFTSEGLLKIGPILCLCRKKTHVRKR